MPEIRSFPEEEEIFDPFDLRPLATLNRRKIEALPGIDPQWAGKTGWELCSRAALIRLIQQQAGALGLGDASPADLPQRLNTLLDSPRSPACKIAESIADLHGRRLGCLIASTVLAHIPLTTPVIAWEAAYLRYWKEDTREIVLGGGLSNGRLGQRLKAGMECSLAACGVRYLRLRLPEYPSYLPLIGAACSLPASGRRAAVVADFGSTHTKRGLAYYAQDGALLRLQVLPTISIETMLIEGKTIQLAEEMARILSDTVRQAGPEVSLAPDIVCSVAAYVKNGQPAVFGRRNVGGYTTLGLISEDITGWFSHQVGEACGREVHVQFTHDGDVAARAYAGQPQTAILMLGTALGVGFAPPADRCRPVSDQFSIQKG